MKTPNQAIYKVLDRSKSIGTSRNVLVAIASWAKPDGTSAYANLKEIARRANCSEKTVRRHRDDVLVPPGELSYVSKGGPKGSNPLHGPLLL